MKARSAKTARQIPQHLVRPPVSEKYAPSQVSAKKSARPQEETKHLTFRQKKELADRQKQEAAEAARKAKCRKSMHQWMMAIKAQLLDGKMDDATLSDEITDLTVAEARGLIKQRAFIQRLLPKIVQNASTYQDSVSNREFQTLVKKFVPKISDYECDQLFIMLVGERNPA